MPVEYAYYSAICLMLAILAVIWILPSRLGYLDSFTGWKDLRIWSTILIGIQIILYMIF